MKKILWYILLMLMVLICLLNCRKEETPLYTEHPASNFQIGLPAMSQMKIAFIGGLNYLDPSLMVDCLSEGSDFMKIVSADNKVEELCKPIFDQAIYQIMTEKPDLLFITGELSFNGERISHKAVAGILKKVLEKGIKVFVIPGNFDINNPYSKAYNGYESSPTPTVTEDEFESIYKDFGFNDAISRDPNSMSYLTPASKKVWILGIDARIYPITPTTLSGHIKQETLEWITYWLAKAKEKNITVLALCHHEITEPWAGCATYGKAYVIQNHEYVENALTDAGLKVIFGAYPNDITMVTKEENVLYDICSVYLPSPPHSYRMIKMEPNSMKVETRYITSINATIPGGSDFLEYSNTCYMKRISQFLINNSFRNLPRGDVNTQGTADYYGLHFAKALHAFYAGDEQFPPEEEVLSQNWPEPWKSGLKSIYTDLPPEDRQFTFDLK
jgi:hypothetical protein